MTNTFFETLKTFIKSMILVFVLVSIANLFIELLLATRTYLLLDHNNILKKIKITEDTDLLFIEQHSKDIFIGNSKTSFSLSTGVKRDFSDALSFNGSSDGRRITNSKLLTNKKHYGVLLGSSQSWGYFVKDEETLSHQIMKKIDTIALDNYSLLGLTLEQSFQYLQAVKQNLNKKDFLLVVGGVADVVNYCSLDYLDYNLRTTQMSSNIGLINFYYKLKKRFNLTLNNRVCEKKEDANIVVEKILNSIELFIHYADKNNLEILIVIPPVTLYGTPNLTELNPNNNFYELQKNYSLVYELLDSRLKNLNSPKIVNLMHTFNESEQFYIDLDSHFNKKGHEKIAKEIIKNMPTNLLD